MCVCMHYQDLNITLIFLIKSGCVDKLNHRKTEEIENQSRKIPHGQYT